MRITMHALLSLILYLSILCRSSVHSESVYNESQCGNIFAEKYFIITSENYPSSYPSGKQCFYLLKGTNCTSKIQIKFLDFDVKASVGCVEDRLEIGQQAALCGVVNGSKVYRPEKGALKLRFISGNEINKTNRGFKLAVSRIDACKSSNTTSSGSNVNTEQTYNSGITTEIIQIEKASEIFPSILTYLPPPLKQCCQNNIFNSKRFFLVSPNFPYAANAPLDCIYIIQRASKQVCRLRINILFFSLGPSNQNSCPYGYLEIDGKYICGCNADLQLTTDFRSSDKKVLRFHSSGNTANEFYGFMLEIIQDDCPKRYSPESEVLAGRSSSKFRFYNDPLNKVSWPMNTNIDQLKLIKEKTLRENPDNDRKVSNVYKHFYFFAPQNDEDISWTQTGQEREETNYVEISTINNILTNYYGYQQCLQWNKNQIVLLNRRYGDSVNQMCKTMKQNDKDVADCTIFNSLTGSIISSGYPLVYPTNQNKCYRIQMTPGYCAVRIYFNDFQIEKSYDCLKDFLAINQHRYCGTYLANRQVTIDTRGKLHQDINFITDANYCGKGFSAEYQQVRCQESNDPITPIRCDPVGTTTTPSPLKCDRTIAKTNFVIRKERGSNFCTFNIIKSSQNVCMILLYFEHFDLPCNLGSITIDEKLYCGLMSGQRVFIDISREKTSIIYRRNSLYFTSDYAGDFLIRGTQISDDCGITPEPARLTLRNPMKSSEDLSAGRSYSSDKAEYPDVCHMLRNNVTIEELPNKICESLRKQSNVNDCKVLKAEVVAEGGRNATKIKLTTEEAKELTYKLIEC